MASSTPCSGVHPDQRQLVARRRASRFDAMILTLSKGLASVAFSALLVQASVAQDAPVLSDPVVDDAGEKGQGVKEVDTSALTEGIAEAHKKFDEYTKQQKMLLLLICTVDLFRYIQPQRFVSIAADSWQQF